MSIISEALEKANLKTEKAARAPFFTLKRVMTVILILSVAPLYYFLWPVMTAKVPPARPTEEIKEIEKTD
jgi:hypothetical protein